MIDKFNTFSIEEKLLVHAILSDYFMQVMSANMVMMTWNLRAYAPENEGVKSLKDFVSFIVDLRARLELQLNAVGIPEEMKTNAPISKTVFQSMSIDNQKIINKLFNILEEKLGDFELIGNQACSNIWNNKLR